MKLKFDPNLEYQQKAISAVVNVFDGQTIEGSDLGFEIGSAKKGELDLMDLGVGNRLEISDEKILENIKKIQKRKSSNIKREDRAGKLQGRNFSVEMEQEPGKPMYTCVPSTNYTKNTGLKSLLSLCLLLPFGKGF